MKSVWLRKMKKYLKDLEMMIRSVDVTKFPYIVDDIIYVGDFSVKYAHDMYNVYHNNFFIGETYTKHGALALIANSNKKRSLRKIMEYDRILFLSDNDIGFFKNVINNTEDEFRKDTIKTRLEVAQHDVLNSKTQLQHIINS